ncbi:hypothetical protein HanRHA438_Chr05g0211761 [Helianthus annuus]|nr:hypothetical protein HanIR_Chr05g0217871 [Helianthus annuus]KAJ0917933.1 hypothetical protein HanRHA438_Chr05g0211761 [Helianthus annuus]
MMGGFDLVSCFLAVSDVGDGGWWRLLEVEVMATVGSGVGDGAVDDVGDGGGGGGGGLAVAAARTASGGWWLMAVPTG